MFRPQQILAVLISAILLVGVSLAQGSGVSPIAPADWEYVYATSMTSGPNYPTALLERGAKGFNPFAKGGRDIPALGQPEMSPESFFQADGFGAITPLSGTPSYTNQVTADSNLDVETSMVTVVRNVGGVNKDHTVIGYIKYSGGNFRNYAAATKTGDANWTYTAMGIPQSYTRSVDPVLTANLLTTGVQPKRVYYVSLLDTGSVTAQPSAISVQWSDDGGFNWSSVVEAARSNTAGLYLDKPDATVSEYSGTAGYIYVCYSKIRTANPYDPYATEIMVTRSEDGGSTWTTPVAVVQGRVQASQIAHSVSYNRVYLSWVNWDDDTIEYAYSDNKGVTWSTVETAASGPLKINENRDMDYILGGAITIPQMRFDDVNNQVELVWHESEYEARGTHTGGSNSTNLVDSTKNFITLGIQPGDYVRNISNDAFAFVQSVVNSTTLQLQTWQSWIAGGEKDFDFGDSYVVKAKNTNIKFVRKTGAGWQSKVSLNVSTGNDQFMPSVDFGSSSDRLIIGYLDRSGDTSTPNREYEAKWAETNAAGTVQSSGAVYGSFPSDPVNNGYGNPNDGWLGDYTDTWFWPYTDGGGSRWHFVFPAGNAADSVNWNIYAAAIL